MFTNKELDYTCIQIFESDGIKDYFEIDPIIFTDKKNNLRNSEIFILQYPEGKELSFSYGRIKSLNQYNIYHSASTKGGSSGSPIISRGEGNSIIGLHYGGYKKKGNIDFSFNLATSFDFILNDIDGLFKPNEIDCIYKIKNNEKEIQLLHDYSISNFEYWDEEDKNKYLDAKIANTKIFEENMELYINGEKKQFNYKYNVNENKEIKVKFKFKKILINMSSMLRGCSSLNSIDLSKFNTNNVTDMSFMFVNCSSLKAIDLSKFNTNNVTNMSYMFNKCSSLKKSNIKINNKNDRLLNQI